jgi:hypothetical protein
MTLSLSSARFYTTPWDLTPERALPTRLFAINRRGVEPKTRRGPGPESLLLAGELLLAPILVP